MKIIHFEVQKQECLRSYAKADGILIQNLNMIHPLGFVCVCVGGGGGA